MDSHGNYRNRSDEHIFTVLGYTDQGLGHLRVTNALHAGAPGKLDAILFGPDDEFATSMHRISSMNTFTRKLLEISQNGFIGEVFAKLYKKSLHYGCAKFRSKINYLLALGTVRVDRLIFISTHFGLAHQISCFKDELKKSNNIEVELVVVVTDDSPQSLWFVPKADLTVVPSKETKQALKKYAKQKGYSPKIEVLSYPLNPLLIEKLSKKEIEKKIDMSQNKTKHINMSIPISGAAVGLDFTEKIINYLEDNFMFDIVSRDKPFTHSFLGKMEEHENVNVFSSDSDFRVVEEYDKMIATKTFLFELTKPSEQCFKAIIPPKKNGGLILLLTEPVGRQEKDNLDFLRRNNLIPDEETTRNLHLMELSTVDMKKAQNWRGVILPKDAKKASKFINWGLKNKLFFNMLKANPKLSDNGAKDFWKLIKYD